MAPLFKVESPSYEYTSGLIPGVNVFDVMPLGDASDFEPSIRCESDTCVLLNLATYTGSFSDLEISRSPRDNPTPRWQQGVPVLLSSISLPQIPRPRLDRQAIMPADRIFSGVAFSPNNDWGAPVTGVFHPQLVGVLKFESERMQLKTIADLKAFAGKIDRAKQRFCNVQIERLGCFVINGQHMV